MKSKLLHDNTCTTCICRVGSGVARFLRWGLVPLLHSGFHNRRGHLRLFGAGRHFRLFGRNFLNQVKIDVLSSQLKCTWFGDEIPFHPVHHFANNDSVRSVLEVQPYRVDTQEAYYVTAAKSTRADIDQVCKAQDHLDSNQQAQLLEILRAHEKLFDGTLGPWKD